MTKIKIILISILVFYFAIISASSAIADNATTTASGTDNQVSPVLLPGDPNSAASSTPTQMLGLQVPLEPEVVTSVKRAKKQLEGITLNHALTSVYKNVKDKKTGKTKKVLSSYSLSSKDIALAIYDPQTKNITVTVGAQSGKSMVFNDPAVSVKLVKFNGVNSKFEVTNPVGGSVIALKYLISNPDSGSKTKIEQGLSPAVYVPFSQNLVTPDVITYGADYLNNIINKATVQLENLPSRAIPGKTITQAVPPAMIKALIYAEHSDTSAILKGRVQDSLDQMNILLALNGPDTYKYSVSNDGFASRGISQFVKSTYDSLVQRHTETSLIKDYVLGMEDHVNSVKAMYLLLDDYAGAVRIKAAQGFTESRVFEYGAASYNGGTTRVANAVNLFGQNWNEDRNGQINSTKNLIASLKSKIKKTSDKKTKAALQSQLAEENNKLSNLQSGTLRNETVNYLTKIYKVVQYFNGEQA